MATLAEDFDQFWRAFPRKTAKIAARKAYEKARKVATAAEILAGIAPYMAHKPDYQDWCHPATFLSKGRWLDEYDVPAKPPEIDWLDDCKALHGGTCEARYQHVTRKQLEAIRGEHP